MSNLIPQDLQKSLENKRGRPLSEKQMLFLCALMDHNFDVRQAGEAVGMTTRHIASYARNLKDEIIELMQVRLIMDAGTALETISTLLTSDEMIPNSNVKLQAAKDVLDRAGLVRREKVEHEHNVSGGLFLLPAKEDVKLKDIEGEVIE